MTLSARSLAIDTLVPMLGSLSRVLAKGAAHAESRKIEPGVLSRARLAPDMFTLQQQVQLACHHARDAVARLTGREPPAHVGQDEDIEALRARIQATVDALLAVPESAFQGAEDRAIVIAMKGADMHFAMNGLQLLRDWSLPHFYFHVVTAYDLLRHNGVELGKPDYMGNVRGYIRPGAA